MTDEIDLGFVPLLDAAPLIIADRAAMSPTGPAPAMTMLSPGTTPAISVAW